MVLGRSELLQCWRGGGGFRSGVWVQAPTLSIPAWQNDGREAWAGMHVGLEEEIYANEMKIGEDGAWQRFPHGWQLPE